MTDVSDILGVKSTSVSGFEDILQPKKIVSNINQKSKLKPKGMNRELYLLMGEDGIAPSIQTNSNIGFKNKRMSGARGQWAWAPIKSSARSDSQIFYHWARADIQDIDYAYSKFNIKLEPITYTDEEYEKHLTSPNWSRSETDHLMIICYEYDLRWPVIVDRYEALPRKPTEELMHRYFSIIMKLKAVRSGNIEFSTKSYPATTFDINFERNRRQQQEFMFKMTTQDEIDEAKLKEELKLVDMTIKRLKKSSKQVVSGGSSSALLSDPSSQKINPSGGKASADVEGSIPQSTVAMTEAKYNGNTAAVIPSNMPPITMYGNSDGPAPGKPCLQSARLVTQNGNINLSKSLLIKSSLLLSEYGMPEHPLPTRAVCDIVDQLHKDAITLISLQSIIAKKEREVSALKGEYAIAIMNQEDLSSSKQSKKLLASSILNCTAAPGTLVVPHGTLLLSGGNAAPVLKPLSASDKQIQESVSAAMIASATSSALSTNQMSTSSNAALNNIKTNPPKKKRKATPSSSNAPSTGADTFPPAGAGGAGGASGPGNPNNVLPQSGVSGQKISGGNPPKRIKK